MAKYNVGVGDAFPADAADRASDGRSTDGRGADDDRRPDSGDDYDRWRYRGFRRHHHNYFFRIAVLLLLIWGTLSIFNHVAPHGLLVAAGILTALGIARLLFRSDRVWDERRAARRAWREERRRSRWEDR